MDSIKLDNQKLTSRQTLQIVGMYSTPSAMADVIAQMICQYESVLDLDYEEIENRERLHFIITELFKSMLLNCGSDDAKTFIIKSDMFSLIDETQIRRKWMRYFTSISDFSY